MQDLERIGRYETVRLLGRGGMGLVYLARDPLIDRLVAVKMMSGPLDHAARERFAREARAAGRLHHENIATIFDVGEHGGEPFLAMEFVEGETLAALIKRQPPLPLVEGLRLLEDACAGLAYAHRAGIVHLDVKPENLIRRADGRLKVLDFGIARVLEGDATQTRHLQGTPRYMSPEQLSGRPVDRRSDIFSMGCVLYELVAGVPAFKGDLPDIVKRMDRIDVTPLTELVPDVNPEFVRMTMRALAYDPSDRYADLDSMRRELAALRRSIGTASHRTTHATATGITHAPAAPELGRPPSAPWRMPLRALRWAASAAVLAALAASAFWALRSDAPTTASNAPQASIPAPVVPPDEGRALDETAAASTADSSPGADVNANAPREVAGALRQPPPAESDPAPSPNAGAGAAVPSPARTKTSSTSPPRSVPAITADAGVPAAPTSTDTQLPGAPRPSPVPSSPVSAPQGPAILREESPEATPVNGRLSPVLEEPDPAAATSETDDATAAPSAGEAVRRVLQAYAMAHEQHDVAALRRMFPTMPASQAAALASTFANALRYGMQIRVIDLQAGDGVATALCEVTREFVPKVGSASSNVQRSRFQLRRAGGEWTVVAVEVAQKP